MVSSQIRSSEESGNSVRKKNAMSGKTNEGNIGLMLTSTQKGKFRLVFVKIHHNITSMLTIENKANQNTLV